MRSWFDFTNTEVGKLAVKEFHVAFYDKGRCYDETFFEPQDALTALTFLDGTDSRVFVSFKDGEVYELTMNKVDLHNV